MRISRKRTMLIVIVVTAVLLSSCSLYADAAANNPISISYQETPPKTVYQYLTYHLEVNWENTNQKKAYDGSFLFTVKLSRSSIQTTDLTLIYQGQTIQPTVSGDSIAFNLPAQTFAASARGSVSADVVFNRQGSFNWYVGVIKI